MTDMNRLKCCLKALASAAPLLNVVFNKHKQMCPHNQRCPQQGTQKKKKVYTSVFPYPGREPTLPGPTLLGAGGSPALLQS